jgi:hypothetical protein
MIDRSSKYSLIFNKLTEEQKRSIVDRAIELLPADFVDGYDSLSYADIIADLFFNDGSGAYLDFDAITLDQINNFNK